MASFDKDGSVASSVSLLASPVVAFGAIAKSMVTANIQVYSV